MIRDLVRGDDGFSLIEVLVALAVSGLIMTAASGLTWAVGRAQDRASRENGARENVIAADRVLRAFVNGAVPDGSRGRAESVVGQRDQVTFLTSGPPILTFDRPRPMSLAVEADEKGMRLLARWIDPEQSRPREEVIVFGARSISLSYFGAVQQGGPAAWRSSWSFPSRLPAAVLLRIDMPALGPPIDLIARTYSSLPYACEALPHEPWCNTDGSSPAEGQE
jgi:general secretion pathway protein J